jgi:hypothetical protein
MRVKYGDSFLWYRSATQCSDVDLPVTETGWDISRIWAIVGRIGLSDIYFTVTFRLATH